MPSVQRILNHKSSFRIVFVPFLIWRLAYLFPPVLYCKCQKVNFVFTAFALPPAQTVLPTNYPGYANKTFIRLKTEHRSNMSKNLFNMYPFNRELHSRCIKEGLEIDVKVYFVKLVPSISHFHTHESWKRVYLFGKIIAFVKRNGVLSLCVDLHVRGFRGAANRNDGVLDPLNSIEF